MPLTSEDETRTGRPGAVPCPLWYGLDAADALYARIGLRSVPCP
jgi:hypothetical protein